MESVTTRYKFYTPFENDIDKNNLKVETRVNIISSPSSSEVETTARLSKSQKCCDSENMRITDNLKVCKECSTVFIKQFNYLGTQQGSEYYDSIIANDQNKFYSNEEINPIQYFKSALNDESNQPNMRFYFKKFPFEKYIPMVFKFYFEDMHYKAEQRMDTLNLAFGYFTQVCVRLKSLEECDLIFLMISCLLLASKLDEIDDSLLHYSTVCNYFLNSKNQIENIKTLNLIHGNYRCTKLEECVLKTLDWNLNQLTPFRILGSLQCQGIVFKSDKIKQSNEEIDQSNCDQTELLKKKSSSISNRSIDAKDDAELITETLVKKCIAGSNYLCHISSLILALQNFKSSLVACACVYVSRKLLRFEVPWNDSLEVLTGYKFEDFEECTDLLECNLYSVSIGGTKHRIKDLVGISPFECSQDEFEKNFCSYPEPKRKKKIHINEDCETNYYMKNMHMNACRANCNQNEINPNFKLHNNLTSQNPIIPHHSSRINSIEDECHQGSLESIRFMHNKEGFFYPPHHKFPLNSSKFHSNCSIQFDHLAMMNQDYNKFGHNRQKVNHNELILKPNTKIRGIQCNAFSKRLNAEHFTFDTRKLSNRGTKEGFLSSRCYPENRSKIILHNPRDIDIHSTINQNLIRNEGQRNHQELQLYNNETFSETREPQNRKPSKPKWDKQWNNFISKEKIILEEPESLKINQTNKRMIFSKN